MVYLVFSDISRCSTGLWVLVSSSEGDLNTMVTLQFYKCLIECARHLFLTVLMKSRSTKTNGCEIEVT